MLQFSILIEKCQVLFLCHLGELTPKKSSRLLNLCVCTNYAAISSTSTHTATVDFGDLVVSAAHYP